MEGEAAIESKYEQPLPAVIFHDSTHPNAKNAIEKWFYKMHAFMRRHNGLVI